MPDLNKLFRLEMDISNIAIRAVLLQLDNKDFWHPISYISRTLNSVKRNYDTMN